MSVTRTSSIITINDSYKLPMLFMPGEEVEIKELNSEPFKKLVKDLKEALCEKIPHVETGLHTTPAYLAANQIGQLKRVALLYLPSPTNMTPPLKLLLINPTYTVIKDASVEAKNEFRISTFLAEQFRFRNDCYAQEINLNYLDANWNKVTTKLNGLHAIAAQMAVNFINGITPLDFNISSQELRNFSSTQSDEKVEHNAKIITTKQAYQLQGRHSEINQSYQFQNDQIHFISAYLEARAKLPIIFDPTTGQKKQPENTDIRKSPSPA